MNTPVSSPAPQTPKHMTWAVFFLRRSLVDKPAFFKELPVQRFLWYIQIQFSLGLAIFSRKFERCVLSV